MSPSLAEEYYDVVKRAQPFFVRPPSRRAQPWWSFLAVFPLSGVMALYILAGSNFHTVEPQRCFRSAQPSARDIHVLARDEGIKTILNFRGQYEEDWYYQTQAAAHAENIVMVDLGFWASSPPPVPILKKLVHFLEVAPTPLLLHCHFGSDRTGLAATLYLLLRTDTSLEVSRRQLSLYFGHLTWGRSGCQGRVLDAYQQWLVDQDRDHSPDLLKQWAFEVYDGQV